MNEQQAERPSVLRGFGSEYKYIVHVRALETFGNVLGRQGIAVPDKSAHVSFASRARLDMKSFKEAGLIWSYSIIMVKTSEDIIEEG